MSLVRDLGEAVKFQPSGRRRMCFPQLEMYDNLYNSFGLLARTSPSQVYALCKEMGNMPQAISWNEA